MKHYGHAYLQTNSSVIMDTSLTSFPTSPTAGQLVFVSKRVWICVEIVSGQPTWIPLTNEIDTFVHTQASAATTWTITHNLNTTTPLVQIYGTDNKVFIPNEITVISNNVVSVDLGVSAAGRAVVMFGDITGADKQTFAYEHHQTNLAATWVIPHNLGYYPIVRVFVGSEEIQPASIVHDSLFQTTITFSQSYVGIARLV